ncbi:BQ5605_C013g07280 [Microbotryum silenes-dioicae]|uniref:BQ5605_C013g07280 protein n=1 Tax=Microbotryum silenes-dioicae TaxID=796604 RepID=A0A2X0LUZ5_9BASI|nr:BQ5605_C013g07280 [Microbotryum silenes-dioicae]
MRSKIGDFAGFYLRASGWAFMGPPARHGRVIWIAHDGARSTSPSHAALDSHSTRHSHL